MSQESFIPGRMFGDIEGEHLQRYRPIVNLVTDKVIVDAACGWGYGSSMLSQSAKFVHGIDVSNEVFILAYKSTKRIILSPEHVDERAQLAFLAEAKRVPKEDGVLVISSRDKRTYSDIAGYSNPFQFQEFHFPEFEEYLKRFFPTHA